MKIHEKIEVIDKLNCVENKIGQWRRKYVSAGNQLFGR